MKPLAPLILLAAGLAAAPGLAQETPEAWVSRLAAVSKKPVELEQGMTMTYRGTERVGEGELLFLDAEHFAIRMAVTITWPDQDQKVHTLRRTLGDGAKQWNEVTNLDTGEGMVQDLPFAQVKAFAKGDVFQGRVHPAQQLLALLNYTGEQTVELSEDSVELVAEVSEQGKSKMVPLLGGVVPKKIVVVLDRETGFPRSWKIQRFTGETVLGYTFTKVRFPEADKIDRKRFVFVPTGKVEPVVSGADADGAEDDQDNQGRTDG